MTTNKQNTKLIDKLKAKIEQLEAECNGLERKREEDRALDRKVCASYRKEIESLLNKIKELESDKHINEIKAQGICWALELASFDCTVHDDSVSVLEKVEKYAEQLRNNNE